MAEHTDTDGVGVRELLIRLVVPGIVAAAALIWAIPAAAAPGPPRGPASGVSVACDHLITTPDSSVSCTINGLAPSESASVLLAGTPTQVTAPPANAAGASTFTLPIPAGTGTRTIQVTAAQSNRTTSTNVAVSNQIDPQNSAAPAPASDGGGTPLHFSSADNQKETIPPRAIIAILVAVLGIVVLASRKQLQRMKA